MEDTPTPAEIANYAEASLAPVRAGGVARCLDAETLLHNQLNAAEPAIAAAQRAIIAEAFQSDMTEADIERFAALLRRPAFTTLFSRSPDRTIDEGAAKAAIAQWKSTADNPDSMMSALETIASRTRAARDERMNVARAAARAAIADRFGFPLVQDRARFAAGEATAEAILRGVLESKMQDYTTEFGWSVASGKVQRRIATIWHEETAALRNDLRAEIADGLACRFDAARLSLMRDEITSDLTSAASATRSRLSDETSIALATFGLTESARGLAGLVRAPSRAFETPLSPETEAMVAAAERTLARLRREGLAPKAN